MLEILPDGAQMTDLVGERLYDIWKKLCAAIEEKYDTERIWNNGGKAWTYEYKYRRGSKTLCALYARKNCIGFMVILGKEERLKFEADQDSYAKEIQETYSEAQTYHDGKWMMFDLDAPGMLSELELLLAVKKAPNRKTTMCGYCCDMCKAFAGNVKKNDQRAILSEYWKKYYGLNIPAEKMQCDGCRCKKDDARRIDGACPVRACVLERKLHDCSACEGYPCQAFLSRKGLSLEEADGACGLDLQDYYEYLGAFDNKSRLDRRKKRES